MALRRNREHYRRKLRYVRSILDLHYLHRDPALAENAIANRNENLRKCVGSTSRMNTPNSCDRLELHRQPKG